VTGSGLNVKGLVPNKDMNFFYLLLQNGSRAHPVSCTVRLFTTWSWLLTYILYW